MSVDLQLSDPSITVVDRAGDAFRPVVTEPVDDLAAELAARDRTSQSAGANIAGTSIEGAA